MPVRTALQCGEVESYTNGAHTVRIRRDKHGCRATGLVQLLKAFGAQAGTHMTVEFDNAARTIALRTPMASKARASS